MRACGPKMVALKALDKGVCQSGRKVVPHNSKSELPLDKLLHTSLNFIVLIIKSISNVDQNKLVTPGGKG